MPAPHFHTIISGSSFVSYRQFANVWQEARLYPILVRHSNGTGTSHSLVMAHMLVRTLFSSLLLASFSINSTAEIEKIAIPGEKGMSFSWWPKLAPLSGWEQDREFSLRYSATALAPIGASFADAETVMYAKALFKPRIPKMTSLAMLIESDKKAFLDNVPAVAIKEAPSLVTADGKKLISLTYTPKEKGNWERVSYFEEGGFCLVFTISSRTPEGFLATAKAYETLIAQYKEKP